MIFGLGLLAAGCAAGARPESPGDFAIAPSAILAAADAAPRGVPGIFAMRVQATGVERGRTFLNSELDYRDQRNLTVAISWQAARALGARYGAAPDIFFRGKAIRVRGEARRVRIDFTDDGRPTGKYYYQTHVPVDSPDQIEVVD
jgi:hypothetical protein